MLLGQHTYILTYRVTGAVNFFADFDELNWNVTGSAWEVTIPKVSATIHLPATDILPTTLCYTGAKGSLEQHCSGLASAGTATYSANEPITIISHWKKGIVTQPTTYTSDREIRVSKFEQLLSNRMIGWAGVVLLPLVAFILMFIQWMKHGRDPEGKKTIVPVYEPPADLRPGEIVVLMSNGMKSAGIGTTIVDLAVCGYLRIEQSTEQKTFGEKTEYTFVKLKEGGSELRKFESAILKALFSSSTTSEIGRAHV